MKSQFGIRGVFIFTAAACVYLATARVYGYGRALLCTFTVLQFGAAIVFYGAAFYSAKEENLRNSLAMLLLGSMIIGGALLMAFMFFQPITDVRTFFEPSAIK